MHALDRPLLSGLVALERQFVTAEELVDAFRIWCDQPSGSLGQILASRGHWTAERAQSLEQLVSGSSILQDGSSPPASNGDPKSTWQSEATSIDDRTGPAVVTLRLSREVDDNVDTPARFKPMHLHARGGLGQVFVAEDLELHRQVALKEIRPDAADDPASRERFVVEAKVTGSLEHPGIVPVYGLGVHADGRPFYAMRFIQGQTLSEAIKKFHATRSGDFDSLDFRQLLGRLVSVCNAIAFAHSRGIVHRDLKPQNVMLGPFGETLVVDWGLAKTFQVNESEATLDWRREWPSSKIPAERESVTAAGEVVGTPAYMSPEQAAGDAAAIGPLSDTYGLGAILYALLTGQSPRGLESSDILEAVREGSLVPPRQANPRIPRALAAICQKAMAHEAAQRYRSPLELAADIEQWLGDEPVTAYAEPWTDTAYRWMRRHRLPVAVASVLLLVTSIALSIGYVAVRKQRDVADMARREALTAKQLARDNAAATRQVIDEYLSRASDERWSNIAGFEGVRIDMANLAVERYRDLLKQQPDDASLVADAGMALRRSANLYRMVGQNEPAEKLYVESVANLKQASNASGAIPKYEQWLCETLCDQSLLTSRVSGPKAAVPPMREALEASRRYQAKQPASLAARQVSARVEGDLANLLGDLGQFDEALRLARSAAITLQEAADKNSRPIANRITAALSGVNLGQTLRDAGRWPDAEQALNRALQRTDGYLKQAPTDSNLRFIHARCLHELAETHAASGDAEKATGEIRESIAELTKLTEEFPKVISFRRKLAEVLTDAAQIDLKRGELASAADGVRQSIELLEVLDARQEFGGVPEHLGSAYLVAGEIDRERKELATARTHLARARGSLASANKFNPDNPKLVNENKRLEALASSLAP